MESATMKLSKLEEKGASVPKVYNGKQTEKTDIEKELAEVKELLHKILQKLDEKS